MLKEQTNSMECKLFPIVWNSDVAHTFRRCHIPHQCILELHECTMRHIPQRTFGTLAVLKPRLVTSFINVLKPCPKTFVLICLQMLSAIFDFVEFQ